MFQDIIHGLENRPEKDATACRIYSESLNGIFLLGNMAVDKRVILKCILKSA
jgi:hypothetical protein